MKALNKWKLAFAILYFIASCNTFQNQTINNTPNHLQDSLQLKDLVKQYLKWANSNASHNSTIFIEAKKQKPTDTNYKSVDWGQLTKSLTKIENSRFFTLHFIENFKSIAMHLDSELKKGTIVWHENEIPNFAAADIDSWCNCQDKPDSFLAKIALSPIVYDNETAIFSWAWVDEFNYKIVAKKTGVKWQIEYLEGFDIKYFSGD